ncbi:FAD-dependent oxidoreductase [Gordonia aichiensis]
MSSTVPLAHSPTARRVLVAGMGDSGVLTAMHLARRSSVVGVSLRPALVSGQEVGLRIAYPDRWARDYRVEFDRMRRLDPVDIRHGQILELDHDRRTLRLRTPSGKVEAVTYDALVIATGVANGFWRRPILEDSDDVDSALCGVHERLALSATVAIVGGGAAACSSAAQLRRRWPEKKVALYHPGELPLPRHHVRTRRTVARRLESLGVDRHGGHRAILPTDADLGEIGAGSIHWLTGQPVVDADAIVWAVGRVSPNTAWLPSNMLTDRGFVRVEADLAVPGYRGVFAVGDVADTDPLRGSARNRADRLVARNVLAHLDGRATRRYHPAEHRWGSVFGPSDNGLDVFSTNGIRFRFPRWTVETLLQPLIVRRGIYGGVRRRSGGV